MSDLRLERYEVTEAIVGTGCLYCGGPLDVRASTFEVVNAEGEPQADAPCCSEGCGERMIEAFRLARERRERIRGSYRCSEFEEAARAALEPIPNGMRSAYYKAVRSHWKSRGVELPERDEPEGGAL